MSLGSVGCCSLLQGSHPFKDLLPDLAPSYLLLNVFEGAVAGYAFLLLILYSILRENNQVCSHVCVCRCACILRSEVDSVLSSIVLFFI